MDFSFAPSGMPLPSAKGEEGHFFVNLLVKAVDEGLDPVYAVLPTGRMWYVNHAACRKLGYTREELLAMHMRDLDPHATPERDAANRARVLAQGSFTLETTLVGKDGTGHPVEVTGTALSLQGQDVIFGNVRDLSGRRIAEQALAESEHLFRDLLERQGEGFATTDPEDRFLFANPVAEEIFGAAPGGLAGRFLGEFLDPEGAERVKKESALRRMGAKSTYDIRIRRPNGEVRTSQITATPRWDDEGRFAGTIGVFRDITDTLAMEEALRQSQKMESLGLLAGGIAHDFNNLLTAVMGNLTLAQAHLADPDLAAPFLEKVERSLTRAADLTRQMLAYSGQGQCQVAAMDLNQVVLEIAHLMEVSIPKAITLRFHLGKDLPPVEADAAQIQQVIMNLITNAAEAIGEGEGFVILGTRVVELEAAPISMFMPTQDIQPGTYVVLDVSDTGVGMSPEVRDRIFDPFFTTKPAGRGLGLSSMLGILRGHGAAIKIRSAENQGSTFEVFFPVCQGEIPPPMPWDSPCPAIFTGRVLLVDDEDGVREATGALLESLGFEVIEASDGVQALERFEAEADHLAVVLMDVTMPRMDGRKAFQAMRKSHPEIPIVLSSGYDKQMSTGGFPQAGFLQKPYRVPELRRALAMAMEGRA